MIMKIALYEILGDYRLTDKHQIGKRVSEFDKKSLGDLYSELQRYYERTLKANISKLQSDEGLNIVQFPNLNFGKFSKRLCLYADKIIVNDPIYDLLRSLEVGVTVNHVKTQLKVKLQQFLDSKELVDTGILHYIPFANILTPVNDEISETVKIDCSDENFRKVCLDNMIIGLDEGETEDLIYSFVYLRLGLQSPSKFSAGLKFRTKRAGSGSVGFVMNPGGTFLLKTNKGEIELKLSKVPKTQISTNALVKTEVDHQISWQAHEIAQSLYLNSLLNAVPIIDFDVMWDLLHLKFGNVDENLKAVPAMLELDLNFLDRVSIKDIIRIREKEKSTFEDFRLTLKGFCEEISSIQDAKDLRKKTLIIKKEKIDPQLRKLDREFKRIKKYRLLRGSAIGLGTLAGTLFPPTSIPALVGGLAALTREYADYSKEREGLKENPLYFIWRVKSHSTD